jgi:hypothetical protein
MCVSEICVKGIRVNQGLGVYDLEIWEKFEAQLPLCIENSKPFLT